jgi:hypothetical protein
MDLGRLWCRPEGGDTAPIGHVHRRQGRRGRSPHARSSVTTTQALRPTAQGAFAIFEGGERPQFIQHEHLHKTFALELIKNVLTNYQQLFCKVCLSSSLLIRDRYASSCLQITLMFTATRALTLITTPPFRLAPQNALRALRFPACPPQSSRRRPKSTSHTHQAAIKLIVGIDAGEPQPGWTRVPAMEIVCR